MFSSTVRATVASRRRLFLGLIRVFFQLADILETQQDNEKVEESQAVGSDQWVRSMFYDYTLSLLCAIVDCDFQSSRIPEFNSRKRVTLKSYAALSKPRCSLQEEERRKGFTQRCDYKRIV